MHPTLLTTAPASASWFSFPEATRLDTPALVVYADGVKANINAACGMVGNLDRLRPHMKTSKCAAVCRLMLDAGITKFKCATIAEAELLALEGAPDVLLAYQPVGPKVDRFFQLVRQYPQTRFSCLADHPVPAKALAAAAFRLALTIGVYIDLNIGMNRSGVVPGVQAAELYDTCMRLKGMTVLGLHVYDGHITDFDLMERARAVAEAFAPVEELIADLQRQGITVGEVVAGGTPTFAIHAQHPSRVCSPGTFVYWDEAYGTAFPDLPFRPAALLLTRVVSLPAAHMATLDLGHKSVAAERDLQHRFTLLQVPDAVVLMQSEEHVVVRLPQEKELAIGDLLFALPFHICPTVALYEQVHVVAAGRLWSSWPTAARNRTLSI